jgi:acyl-coenzyme A synthetase/AMP-(fatty) acid ligase
MFVGRRDHQVKVRGHRVELMALESVLSAHPAVDQVAAVALHSETGGRLAAFLVPRRESVPDGEIRRFVAERLPGCYQPDRLEWLPELPRTPTGKCDRAILLSAAG